MSRGVDKTKIPKQKLAAKANSRFPTLTWLFSGYRRRVVKLVTRRCVLLECGHQAYITRSERRGILHANVPTHRCLQCEAKECK
jgi:hypothetical protein